MNKQKDPISSLGTIRTFLRKGTCSETLCGVLDQAYGRPLPPEERASQGLAGGLMKGYQCGQLWGAALAAGARAYQLFGPGPRAEAAAVAAAQHIVTAFRKRNKEINCLELTGVDLSTAQNHPMRTFLKVFFQGKVVGCFTMSASTAHLAFREINATLADSRPVDAPAQGPVSCAAELARRMGASELHTVMAAGLAGGIGLSGGACGALGAALWLIAMREGSPGGLQISQQASDAIDRFVECADYEFECEKIVGKRFENAKEHAEYVCSGGCKRIIEDWGSGFAD